MGVFDAIKKIFIPKRKPGDLGDPYIKPAEQEAGATGIVVKPSGDVLRDVPPRTPFVGGGGGGTATPVPKTPTYSADIEETRTISKEIEGLKERAVEEGVSPEVQARREHRLWAVGVTKRAEKTGVSPEIQAIREFGKPIPIEETVPQQTTFFDFVGAGMSRVPEGIEKIGYYYGKAERKVSGFIPSIKGIEEHMISKARGVPGFEKYWKERKAEFKPSPYYGVGLGMYEQFKEKPVTTLATTAAFAAVPAALGGIGSLARLTRISTVAAKFPTVTQVVGTTVKVAVPTVYGISVAGRVGTAKEPYYEAGRITAGEIIPIGVGGTIGAAITPKITGLWRTRGLKEIPTQELVAEEIITGQKTFPTAPPRKHLKIFLKGEYGLPGTKQPLLYHAAPQPITGLTVGKGESELAGLYGAPSISAYFLKIKPGKYTLYGGKLFEPFGRPTVAAITPTKFIRARRAKPGTAFVPGIKTEVEAILPPKTELIPTTQRYYFKWKGVRVPIKEFGVAPSRLPIARREPISKIAREYYLPSKYPVTTPGSYGVGIGLSYKPSYKPSYRASYKPSYKVGYTPPYKPSYVPPYQPSYTPPYKPSYIPPYKPPYTPPYTPYYPGAYPTRYKPPKTPPLIIPFPKLKLVEEPSKLKISRTFFYQPGLWTRGLKGIVPTKATKVPELGFTGITPRFDVPTYRIRRRKK